MLRDNAVRKLYLHFESLPFFSAIYRVDIRGTGKEGNVGSRDEYKKKRSNPISRMKSLFAQERILYL